jgi:hypothetical protein
LKLDLHAIFSNPVLLEKLLCPWGPSKMFSARPSMKRYKRPDSAYMMPTMTTNLIKLIGSVISCKLILNRGPSNLKKRQIWV